MFETHQLVCLSHLFFVVAHSWPFKDVFQVQKALAYVILMLFHNLSVYDHSQGLLDLDGRNSQKYLHQT